MKKIWRFLQHVPSFCHIRQLIIMYLKKKEASLWTKSQQKKRHRKTRLRDIQKGLANANKFKTHIILSIRFVLLLFEFNAVVASKKNRRDCRFKCYTHFFFSIQWNFTIVCSPKTICICHFFPLSLSFSSFDIDPEILSVIARSNYIYQVFFFLSSILFIWDTGIRCHQRERTNKFSFRYWK